MKDFFKNKQIIYSGLLFVGIIIVVFIIFITTSHSKDSINASETTADKTLKSSSVQNISDNSREDLTSNVKNNSSNSKVNSDSKNSTTQSSKESDNTSTKIESENEVVPPKGAGDSDTFYENGIDSKSVDNVNGAPESDSKGSDVTTSDTLKSQSKLVDDDPSYIKVNKENLKRSEIKNLTVGNKTFTKGNGNLILVQNKGSGVEPFILNNETDWVQFKSYLNLSDNDYNKVIKYFNTVKQFIKDNKIEIAGFGG